MNDRFLLIDTNNILYRNFFAINEDGETTAALAQVSTLFTLKEYKEKYKPSNIILAFDDRSWRKEYTEDIEECVTHKKYKGNRRANLTPKEEQRYEIFDKHVNDFFNMLKKNTGLIVIRKHFLEADDIIAGVIDMYPEHEHIIVSSDKDYLQLLKNDGSVKLIDPIKKKERTLDEWDGDSQLFLFEKCFRGDISDNVMSSYPRLRKTKILTAYSDEYTKTNLMNHTFTELVFNAVDNAYVETEYKTSDLFNENKLLMDLTAQPDSIKNLIKKTISDAFDNKGKFNYFQFLQYCGKNDLRLIIDSMDNFVKLLANIHSSKS